MLCMLVTRHVTLIKYLNYQKWLVELQVVMVYLSTWNLSLVTVDLPSFLGGFVVFCVLVRRRERKVCGLSGGVVVYSERRLPLLIFLSVVCVWVALLHVLSMCEDGMSVFVSCGCFSSWSYRVWFVGALGSS